MLFMYIIVYSKYIPTQAAKRFILKRGRDR